MFRVVQRSAPMRGGFANDAQRFSQPFEFIRRRYGPFATAPFFTGSRILADPTWLISMSMAAATVWRLFVGILSGSA